ncbi:MAG: hypothetical protein PWQ93_1615, partial [Clostridiales bacterium]|nr:hypothetical protein [Clostridiales bacterium]
MKFYDLCLVVSEEPYIYFYLTFTSLVDHLWPLAFIIRSMMLLSYYLIVFLWVGMGITAKPHPSMVFLQLILSV